jgi:hypothetical protein
MLVGSRKLKAHEGVSTLAKRMATSLHLGQVHGYFSPLGLGHMDTTPLGLGHMDTTPLGLGHMDTSLYTPFAVRQKVSTLG